MNASRFGICIYSWWGRLRRMSDPQCPQIPPAFRTPVDIVEACAELGVSSLQTDVAGWGEDDFRRAREVAEALSSHGLKLEGLIELPVDTSDILRFQRELEAGKMAGASIFRIMCMLERRYEVFQTSAQFQQYRAHSLRRLRLAQPVLHELDVRLSIENHKDWLADDLLQLLEELDDSHFGVTLDTGNNIALLEDPYEVIRKLAPHSLSCHLKDMAVQPCEDGFEMSEVPLGQGFLDLPEIIRLCRAEHPDLTLHLEMPTRDPLWIPCRTEGYWGTFPDRDRERLLPEFLEFIQQYAHPNPLPRVSHLPLEEQLRIEHESVVQCVDAWQTICDE